MECKDRRSVTKNRSCGLHPTPGGEGVTFRLTSPPRCLGHSSPNFHTVVAPGLQCGTGLSAGVV